MRLNRISILLIILMMIIAGLFIQSGGLWETLAYDCKLTGEALGRPWQWVKGACYIQQVDGTVIRVDTNSNVPNR